MPKPAIARFALAGFAAALLLAACSDRVPVPATPAPSPTGTPAVTSPVRTPQPTSAPPSGTADAIPLEIGPEAPFPADTALILETGCWQCDGPPTGLLRVYPRPGGEFAIETLLDPFDLGIPRRRDATGAERWPHIAGYAISPDTSGIVAGICIDGSCAVDGLDAWSPDSVLAVYHSSDGGVTWEKVGELDAGLSVRGIVSPGRYLVARSAVRNEITYEVFPEGVPVKPPQGSRWTFEVLDGEALWWTEDSRVLRGDGSTFVDFGYDTHPSRASTDGSTTVVIWHWTTYFISVIEKGSPLTFELPGLSLAMIPFTGESLLGNVTYASGRYAPSLVNTKDGVLRPLGEPFLRPDFPSGRNHIVAVQTGPFARVITPGSCLNIRVAPSLDSNILTCAADRVLLRDHGETVDADGITWARITTPSAVEGWAAAVYLER